MLKLFILQLNNDLAREKVQIEAKMEATTTIYLINDGYESRRRRKI